MKNLSRRDLIFKMVPAGGFMLWASGKMNSAPSKQFSPPIQTSNPNMYIPNSEILLDFTFSNFIVGRNNEHAHAAAYRVAKSPGHAYNPLYIHAPPGMGKSHLLNAIGNHIRFNNPSLRVARISAEKFLYDCIESIRRGQMKQFREYYRLITDVLLMDDIHVLARGQSVQEELYYTINAFTESGRQLVVTSDKLPKETDGMDVRVQSRLESGLIVDIRRADQEARVAFLNHKAAAKGFTLPDDVTRLVAKNSRRSMAQLNGNFNKLTLYSGMTAKSIDLDLVKTMMGAKLI